MNTHFDLTYEIDFDGGLGSLISVDAHGHLDHADTEVFLADVVERELYEASEHMPTFGVEIEYLWRSTHPLSDDDDDGEYDTRWTYHYTDTEREHAIAVTRFQISSPWSRPSTSPTGPRATRNRRTGGFLEEGVDHFPLVCIHHPEETAVTAIPETRFIDPDPACVIDGHVHYCGPCAKVFSERLAAAQNRALAPVHAKAVLNAVGDADVLARAFGFPLRTDDISHLIGGTDHSGASRRAVRAFLDAYRAAGGHRYVVRTPGFLVLSVTDLTCLVEHYCA